MKTRDGIRTATLRLILAALKDRDIAERGKGNGGGLADTDILALLQTMVKQRRESIEMYTKGGRDELAAREAEEITIIGEFLPRQLSADEVEAAIKSVIAEVGAEGLKDMGRTMTTLREKYAGRMDFSVASGVVKAALG